MADANRSSTIRCVIVTPEATVFDERAKFVSLPLFDGERGIAHGHSPFIGRLGAGEVRVVGEHSGAAEAARGTFVEGGFVEVGHNSVTVITQRAVPGDKLSLAEANAGLEKIRSSAATGDEAITAKMTAEKTARALVRAAKRRE